MTESVKNAIKKRRVTARFRRKTLPAIQLALHALENVRKSEIIS